MYLHIYLPQFPAPQLPVYWLWMAMVRLLGWFIHRRILSWGATSSASTENQRRFSSGFRFQIFGVFREFDVNSEFMCGCYSIYGWSRHPNREQKLDIFCAINTHVVHETIHLQYVSIISPCQRHGFHRLRGGFPKWGLPQ